MILITGANGFVGHKLMELCKDTAASPSLRNVTQEMVNRMIEERMLMLLSTQQQFLI